MKKLLLLLGMVVLLASCNENHRYTQDSKEIDIVKATINYYDFHQWDSLKYSYADNAKIYYNSRKNILSVNDLKSYFTRNDESFSIRAFEDESREYEMIEDNNGKTWVNFWGLWKGHLKANDKQIIIPVHITYEFEDRKIIKEYGYWNTNELTEELKKIAVLKAQSTEVEINKKREVVVKEIEEVED